MIFDCNLILQPHITSLHKASYFHLHHIARIRKFLTPAATKTFVHSLTMSRLDYCNSALVILPETGLSKLQSVQNSAAWLLSLTKKSEHITPVLKELHWLPVRQRVLFKVLVVTYKVLQDMARSYTQALLQP